MHWAPTGDESELLSADDSVGAPGSTFSALSTGKSRGNRPVSAAPANSSTLVSQRDRLLKIAAAKAFDTRDPARALISAPVDGAHAVDLVTAFEDEPHLPDDIFRRLRWGGQFLYASRRRRDMKGLGDQFAARGFEVSQKPAATSIERSWLRVPWRLPIFSKKVHYFTARKTELLLPREFSDRFTYRVQLVRNARSPLGYVVQKEVPSFDRVVARLRHKFPDAPVEVIEKRARKFTEKIFPVFLTREAAMLKILERDIPGPFRRRVPHVIDLEQDERGFVRKLRMNWLRNGGPKLSQLEFARQSAELLDVLHDRAGMIHLDLRLDNIVVTEHGVGFVDFGSAVRVGENLRANPMLHTIFEELMKTSQIQRMLEQMTRSGHVTSQILTGAQGQVDKAVDLFYLAVQINNPLGNPDFEGLVDLNPTSVEATMLAALTEDVLKPEDPKNPIIRSAGDFLRGIHRIQNAMARG